MVTLRLCPQELRTAFVLTVGTQLVHTLLDTGASLPVWSAKYISLLRTFEDVKQTKFTSRLSGFGGGAGESVSIYRIPELSLSEELTIHNLLVAVVDRALAYRFILSACLCQCATVLIDRDRDLLLIDPVAKDLYCVPICMPDTTIVAEVHLTTCPDTVLSFKACNEIVKYACATGKKYWDIIADIVSIYAQSGNQMCREEIAIRNWEAYKHLKGITL